MNENERAASIYTAAGTLVLALATGFLALFTAWSVTSSNAQEKRRSEEALARENRDRRERYLDGIIEWANDVNIKIYDHTLFGNDASKNYMNLSIISFGLLNKGMFMESISRTIFKNEKLTNSIRDTCNEILKFGASCRYFADGVVGGKFAIENITNEQILEYTKELDSALKSYKKNEKCDIDVIAGKLEKNMRVKANLALDVCATTKSELIT